MLAVVTAAPLFARTVTGVTNREEIPAETPLTVKKSEDFSINGKGDHTSWTKAEWIPLTKLDAGGIAYPSRFKIMYSTTGIYVLFQGDDEKISTKDYKDFDNIFNGDVFEVFFHPVPAQMVYFEYEVNQLDKELVLAISNIEGHGYTPWIPWSSTREKSGVKKMVNVTGGEKKVNGTIRSWSAEIFFPYSVLGLLPGVPPRSGDIWNANFCRLDYDSGKMVKWSWTPSIKESFHELKAFRSVQFE